jgi:uracil-DNA glycosylase
VLLHIGKYGGHSSLICKKPSQSGFFITKSYKMSIAPDFNCPICPRLLQFREDNRQTYPAFFNGPVPSFGGLDAELLIVGLAPGLQGANATGRPFTGDYAGDILYRSLLSSGFAKGSYTSPRGEVISGAYEDNLTLVNCRITNAVRCVPPENKPEPSEIKNCNNFLKQEIAAMPNLKMILSLGLVSHGAVLKATGHKATYAKFTHGAVNRLANGLLLVDSYHCSRYNINTGRLSQAMFDAVLEEVKRKFI